MKLFVICACGEKIYLEIDFPVGERSDLQNHMDVSCPICGKISEFTNRNIFAECSFSNITTGAIVGGLVGFFVLGPVVSLIGAGMGSLIGAESKKNDDIAVRRFNRS